MAQVPIHRGLFTPPDDPRGPRLLVARCGECQRLHFPATDTCPYCTARACTIDAIGRTGRRYVHTVVTNRPPGYRGEVPYGFGVVELPEGLRVVSRLVAPELDALRSGLEVELEVAPLFINDDGDEVLSYAYRAGAGALP